MVTVLRVDLAGLADVQIQLIHVTARLGGHYPAADGLRQPQLQRAARDLDEAWAYRRRRAADVASDATRTLRDVITAFQEVDRSLTLPSRTAR